MADKATDLVVSYTVQSAGNCPGYERLQEALNAGYRVVDLVATPISPGGGSTGFGAVSVTVLLTTAPGDCPYHRRGKG